MSRDTINAICRTFPGAELSDPWGGGHDAWKVGGKMFACIGSKLPGATTPAARLLSRGSNWGLSLRRLMQEVVAGGADEAVRPLACESTRPGAWPEP